MNTVLKHQNLFYLPSNNIDLKHLINYNESIILKFYTLLLLLLLSKFKTCLPSPAQHTVPLVQVVIHRTMLHAHIRCLHCMGQLQLL